MCSFYIKIAIFVLYLQTIYLTKTIMKHQIIQATDSKKLYAKPQINVVEIKGV